MQGKAWFAWEWLYDCVVGALHLWAGLNGVVLFTSVVIALTFALVFRRMMARGAHLPVAILILLLALAAVDHSFSGTSARGELAARRHLVRCAGAVRGGRELAAAGVAACNHTRRG